MIPTDLLTRLRLAATVALATAACTQKKEPPTPDTPVALAPPSSAVETALVVEDAAPRASADVDGGAEDASATPVAASPDAGALGLVGLIGRAPDECLGCGMGGRLDHPRALGGPPPKGACSMPPTEPEVEHAKPRFLACYERGLAAKPSAAGQVVLRLTVNDAGEVTAADVVSSSVGSASVDACLEGVARRLVLKPGRRTVTVPLVFRHEHT